MATLSLLAARPLDGALKELAALQLAEAALARGMPERVEGALAALTRDKLANPEDVWMMRARVEDAAGHRAHALESYRRLYYDYPLSTQAAVGAGRASAGCEPPTDPAEPFERGLARAERFYSAKRWADARMRLCRALAGQRATSASWSRCGSPSPTTTSATAARRARRCGRSSTATPRGAEARYISLLAAKALGDRAGYVRQARELASDFPRQPVGRGSAEQPRHALHHRRRRRRGRRACSASCCRAFPRGRYAERAAWKVGWRAYRAGDSATRPRCSSAAAATAPRADNRPAWLYWSGRARDQLDDPATANARYRLVVADYQNSLLRPAGVEDPARARRAAGAAGAHHVARPARRSAPVVETDDIIRVAAHRADCTTTRCAKCSTRSACGATRRSCRRPRAWIRHQQGLGLTATERFNALRGAITTMRRAYPQFMAAGGEALPPDVLRIIFPLDYWPLITKYSELHQLDPYLIAALMAQESTFTAEIRSHANAYGLMQMIPDTGRRYARKLGITRFSTAMLRQPETNVRHRHAVLQGPDRPLRRRALRAGRATTPASRASTAGPRKRPGLPQDEFIDNIPFPETQTYVKRILGTAEDYRRLYGGGLLDPNLRASPADGRQRRGEAGATATQPRPRRRRPRRSHRQQAGAPLRVATARRWTICST